MPYKEIDKKKWDDCISKARNRMLYGFSFYLDQMAANWDGLVLNDYKAVMPLTWKKKMQIKYLYQPAFMQQGGIFSTEEVSSELTGFFLEEAAQHFKFAEFSLNHANITVPGKYLTQGKRINYILPLDDYEKNFVNYHPAFTKSLRRIKKFDIRYKKTDDFTSIIQYYKELYNERLPSFMPADYKNLIAVCKQLNEAGKIISRLAYSSDNKLLASLVLIRDADRLYNVISCINEGGKKLEANYFLYDRLIEEFSGQELVLDLEGSEVRGIAAFYKKMNPVAQPYPVVKFNKLHPILKVFKK